MNTFRDVADVQANGCKVLTMMMFGNKAKKTNSIDTAEVTQVGFKFT
jgi:hypothetical protein